MSKNIAILMGGLSGEYDVSLKTGERVAQSLHNIGYRVYPLKVDKNFLNWLNQNLNKVDIFFNALHGCWGEDGRIQGVLDYTGKPYTHSGVLASALAMNKNLTRQILISNNLPVAKGKVVIKNSIIEKDIIDKPYVVKPISEGSSLGIRLVDKNTNLNNILKSYDKKRVLIEEYIPGRELTVAIKGGEPIGILEISSKHNIYDFKSKYIKGTTTYSEPLDIPKNIINYILEISSKTHEVIGCNGVTRVDIRYNQKKEKEGVVILEINTQPGLTENSLVPMIAKNKGISFDNLIDWIVKNAKENHEK